MNEAGANMFTFNKTNKDNMNAPNNYLLTKSKNKIFNKKDGLYCQTVTSSPQSPVTMLTKPRGNMTRITEPLVGRIQQITENALGQWYGFGLLGKNNRKICILTAYNVSQETPA